MAYMTYMRDDETSDKTFQMRVSEAFLSRVDEWRRGQPDIPPRAEAIRRLVDAGIEATRPKKATKAHG